MNNDRRRIRRLRRELIQARRETREAREEARTDALTGLGNKRRWAEWLGELVHREEPFSIVLFDVANLKAANTAVGHERADAILAEIASSVRDGDLVGCRIGGDEFAVILPGIELAQALSIRSRIEEQVGQLLLPAGPLVFLVGDAVYWEPAGPTLPALLAEADFALERRKAHLKRLLGQPEGR